LGFNSYRKVCACLLTIRISHVVGPSPGRAESGTAFNSAQLHCHTGQTVVKGGRFSLSKGVMAHRWNGEGVG